MKNKIINFFFLAVTILCLIFLGRSIVNLDINWLILLELFIILQIMQHSITNKSLDATGLCQYITGQELDVAKIAEK